jgi:soluble lytic murein transglycosylase-like protein
VIFLLVFGCWGCKPEVVETPNEEPVIEGPAKIDEPPTVEVEIRDTRIPSLAYRLKRTVRGEINYHWGLEQDGTIFYAQIHQESAWNPEAKSAYASGLAQFTPDTADWISKLYPADLGENNPLDCRWAVRALIKYDKWLYVRFSFASSDDHRWRFSLSGYNGGAGWVSRDRSLAEQKGKDPSKWNCNVEHYSARSKAAFKENRDYVVRILEKWMPIYEGAGFF